MDSLEAKARGLLTQWLDRSDIFRPTDPHHVVIAGAIHRIMRVFKEGGSIIDLGGGISLTNGVLAQLGMKVYVVDLLDEYYPHSSLHEDGLLQVSFLREKGVHFIKADLLDCNLLDHFRKNSIDRITSYHVIEHFHSSPRRLLEDSLELLNGEGFLFIEVPNAVNILKRFKVLCGRTNYTPYHEYYFSEKYLLHIREYTLGDLMQLAHNLGFERYEIYGRNWYGTLYTTLGNQLLAKYLDKFLQTFPGCCGSLFLKLEKSKRKREARGGSENTPGL